MNPAQKRALAAVSSGAIEVDRVDGDGLPEDFYPDGWLARAEDLDRGHATPGDWKKRARQRLKRKLRTGDV